LASSAGRAHRGRVAAWRCSRLGGRDRPGARSIRDEVDALRVMGIESGAAARHPGCPMLFVAPVLCMFIIFMGLDRVT